MELGERIYLQDNMACDGLPVVPDPQTSSVYLSATSRPIGSVIEVQVNLRGGDGKPTVGPGVSATLDAIVELPGGGSIRMEFPNHVALGGRCKAKFGLAEIGVHRVVVKICGVAIKECPIKVASTVRGKLLKTYSPLMNQPHDIIKRENIFVVTDKAYNQVQVFDEGFRPANKFCSPEMSGMGKFDPYAIAWTGSTFVVTDTRNHCVVEFKNFVPLRIFGKEELQQPAGIAVGKNGFVYVADGLKHCIIAFDQNRKCKGVIGGKGSAPGQLDTPWFMEMNSHGNLVVAEFNNHRVQIFNPTTSQSVRVIDVKHNGKTWDCRGLALDRNDNIYVTVRCGFMRGFSTETVVVYAPTGEFLGNFGEGFNYVRGLTVIQQGLQTIAYVVDGAHHRIAAYEV